MSESIAEIVKSAFDGCVAGHGNKSNFRILGSSFFHERLMTVAVGNDEVAALVNEVESRFGAGSVFGNAVLPNELIVGKAESLGSLLDALNVRVGIAFVFIAEKNKTNLEICVFGVLGVTVCVFVAGGRYIGLTLIVGNDVVVLGGLVAARCKAEYEAYCQKDRKKLLHVCFPPEI